MSETWLLWALVVVGSIILMPASVFGLFSLGEYARMRRQTRRRDYRALQGVLRQAVESERRDRPEVSAPRRAESRKVEPAITEPTHAETTSVKASCAEITAAGQLAPR